MTYEQSKKALLEVVRFNLDASQKRWEGWLRRAADDPAWALHNCDDEFEAAAWLELGKMLVQSLTSTESDATLYTARDYALTQVKYMAQSSSRSTSTTSNLMARTRLRVWAQIEELLAGAVAKIEPAR